jgi:hypothetical protein
MTRISSSFNQRLSDLEHKIHLLDADINAHIRNNQSNHKFRHHVTKECRDNFQRWRDFTEAAAEQIQHMRRRNSHAARPDLDRLERRVVRLYDAVKKSHKYVLYDRYVACPMRGRR